MASKLQDLINRLCPNGVEYRRLGDCVRIRNGSDYKQLQPGDIPVFGSGGLMTYVDRALYDKVSVLIPRKGSIDKLYYVDKPFWTVDTLFYTEIDLTVLVPKYLFYVLQKEHLEQYNTAGGVPSLTQGVLNKVLIPVPPLEVQSEIVQILDNFAELTAELEKRKKQYEHYRRALLCGVESSELRVESSAWPMVKLGDVCKPITPSLKIKRLDYLDEGEIPIVSQEVEFISGYCNCKDSKIPHGEYVCFGDHSEHIKYVDFEFVQGADGLKILKAVNNRVTPKFLYFAALSNYRRHDNYERHYKYFQETKIPLPPLAEQRRIVSILDRFDRLCNDLTSGLPAEIAARKKQYAYYRDKLLELRVGS